MPIDLTNFVSGTSITNAGVLQETPTPATDGTTKTFTVANNYVSGSLKVYIDGIRQIPTTDYSETTATTFTMVVAPASDEVLRVDYEKA